MNPAFRLPLNIAFWACLFLGALLLDHTNPTTPELLGSALLGIAVGIASGTHTTTPTEA